MTTLEIRAVWDDEASVWVAGSDDVLGLIAEAVTLESLMAKLETPIPELMELNCGITGAFLFRLVAERTALAQAA
ncbi:MAG TPA: DUF1902 domain-containing protein [Candidatus Competibacteraceae bacterium]|nr:DUF1902 domain-containing protein [Candidatus Competibacteraceae bacterium]HRZ05839.1 DUF1902 domain-containing protein [Candidatus Competibacteraceae bacterium]HSA47263.1 DUF1902 domain-containing protein [Candidatus Competibacteraceae bacterium]